MPYSVYVLLCKNGAYYTGYTRDVKKRMRQHLLGVGARYVRIHKPQKIVYIEEFETRSQAMKREREIKQLSHAQKKKMALAFQRKTSTKQTMKNPI